MAHPRRPAPRRSRATLALASALVLLAMLAVTAMARAPARPRTRKAAPFTGLRSVGPLFHGARASQHFCTASVVHSPRGDVLLTAAHCVTGNGAGLWFAPGFHDGISPYGRWRVTGLYVDPSWIKRQDPRRDFAFLTVAPAQIHGRRTEIERVTGAVRLALHAAAGRRVTIPAYPAGTDTPVTCTTAVYYHGFSPAFDCDDYVDGTSGAPWLAHTGTGPEVVALIGGLHQGGCTPWTSYSPPFGAPVSEAYERAIEHESADIAPQAGSDGC